MAIGKLEMKAVRGLGCWVGIFDLSLESRKCTNKTENNFSPYPR
jgi:hypothetical protein